MATAEELLRVATDPILTIDVMSRKITIPKAISLLGVESDESVQKLKFSMPRNYNNIDLSEYDIRINYENANKEGDVSPAADVTVTSDTITFTWIVGRFAVMYEGEVTFVVCLKKIDDNGDVVNEFNTTRTTLPVAKGLETDESAVMDANPDVITAIAVETLEQAKENGDFTPVKGVDYYTEEERDEFADLIVRDHNGAFANALKGTVSGEIIRVDDVSPIEHTVECRVHGKNLFNINTVVDGSFGKYSVENNSVTFEYASDYGNYFPFAYWLDVRPNTDYSLSIGTHTSIANIYGYVDKVFGTQVFARVLHGADFITFNSGNNTRILIGFYSVTSHRDLSVTRETVSNIQIEEGSVATEYEPGVDPTTVTVTGCGKNLFKSAVKSQTIDGVTFTVKDDGSINANGTAEKTIFLSLGPIQPKIGVNYYLSGSPQGSSLSTYMLYIHNELTTVDYYDVGDGVAFTGAAGNQKLIIAVYAGITVNNILFRPQVELGSESIGYEPYSGTTYTPNEDGSVDVVSVSPTMTLMTDTAGVTIEAEYSKDINSIEFGGGGSEDIDLSEYVKNTDYATMDKAGVVKVGGGLVIYRGGTLQIDRANESEIVRKQSGTAPIVPYYLDRAVHTGVTTNTIPLTDEEKAAACNWLGAVSSTPKEYELINIITVTPDTDGTLPQHVIFSTDSEGNPFEMGSFYVKALIGATDGSAAKLSLFVNDNPVFGGTNIGHMLGTTPTGWALQWIDLGENNGALCVAQGVTSGSTFPYSLNINSNTLLGGAILPYMTQFTPVKKIEFWLHVGTAKTFVAGSTFELWGVRK